MARATTALAFAQLEALTADAAPLSPEASECVAASTTAAGGAPSFAALASSLGIPATPAATDTDTDTDTDTAARPADRLPLRIVSGEATPAERSCWRAYAASGLHELLSQELIEALAARIKATLAAVTIRGLKQRPELNGEAAMVVGPLHEPSGRVPVRVIATGEHIRAKPQNVFAQQQQQKEEEEQAQAQEQEEQEAGRRSAALVAQLPLLLECGAGNGVLAQRLSVALAGWARVAACDNGRDRIASGGGAAAHETAVTVQRLSSEAAIERLQPSVVLVSWMPSGIDWTCHCRECPSVREYILLGERDGSTCGDGWATWGLVPDNGYEYGLDDDSPKPYAADGFVLTELADVSRWQICRFDSAAARGFSTAVAFTRADHHERLARQQALREADDADGETLAESWERMQRSLAEGRAERLPIQIETQIQH